MKGKKTGGRDFPKGQSGNPNGRPPLPEDLKEARQLNKVEFERILNKIIYLPQIEIKRLAQDPQTPGIERLVCKMLMEACNHADISRANFIVERLVGKVADNLNVGGSLHAALVTAMAGWGNAKK